jgi:glycosyltransferase involved in cell wall biosynthesis
MNRPVRILSVATEWASGHGGLSTFNRLLCTALAAAGAQVSCRVPGSTRQEQDEATAAGVTLLPSPAMPGGAEYEGLTRRTGLPDVAPDLIIGHGQVTGPYARVLAEDVFTGCARYHVIHTVPDEAEWHRVFRRDVAAPLAEQRTKLEWDLGSTATRVVAVGPRLYRRALVELSGYQAAPQPLRLDPGFDIRDPAVRRPPPGRPAKILLMGRLHDDVKGVDIAARAVGRALELAGRRRSELEIVLRGTDPTEATEFRQRLIDLAGPPSLRVIPRSYSLDGDELRRDMLRSVLVLMPSRAEPFGLAALEAIVAGTPVLISDQSGLAELLTEILEPDDARRLVIPVLDAEDSDTRTWGHAIATVLQDPPTAFAATENIRQVMAGKRTWAMAASQLLSSLNV